MTKSLTHKEARNKICPIEEVRNGLQDNNCIVTGCMYWYNYKDEGHCEMVERKINPPSSSYWDGSGGPL